MFLVDSLRKLHSLVMKSLMKIIFKYGVFTHYKNGLITDSVGYDIPERAVSNLTITFLLVYYSSVKQASYTNYSHITL